MSTFKYCSLGKYTASECEDSGGTLLTSNKASTTTYSKVTVTGTVPENTNYVSCMTGLYIKGVNSGSIPGVTCSYDESTRTVTFSSATMPSGASSATVDLPDGCDLGEDCKYAFTYRVKAKENGTVINDGMRVIAKDGVHSVQMGKITTMVNSTINDSSGTSEFKAITENIKAENINYEANSGLKFMKDVYNRFFGIEMSEFGSYRTIIDALVYDKASSNSATLSKYYRRIDYSDATDTEKRINQMLVPGEYGGRVLRGNIGGDRATILFKQGIKSTLEVGDVIMAFKSNDEYKKTFTSQYVWLFTGYDSNKDPNFIRAYYSSNSGKTLYTVYNSEAAKTGYQLYKEIYSYDLFFVLRPTRLYGYKSLVEKPTNTSCKSNLIYNGSNQILTKDNTNKYVYSDNSGSIAGNYTVKASLINGYMWNDKTINDSTISCSIAKYTPTINLPSSSGNFKIGKNSSFAMTVDNIPACIGLVNATSSSQIELDNNYELDNVTGTYSIGFRGLEIGNNISINVNYVPNDLNNCNSAQVVYTANITNVEDTEIEINDNLVVDEDNYTIGGIAEKTSISSFINSISFSGTVIIVNENETSILNRNYIVTGDIIKFIVEDDSVIEYTLLVRGDVNSDGFSNKQDVSELAKYIINGTSNIREKYLLAGDMDGSGDIKINDIIKLLQ